MDPRRRIRLLKAATFVLACLPLAKIVADGLLGRLGANPIEMILNRLGFWTLTLLLASLVPTPAHELLGLAWPVRLRRMLGLFAFSYATLHLSWYAGVDHLFDVALLAEDVVRRKFMAVGFVAWLLLVPLAVTSTDRWVRRLGYARWKRLHRLVYAVALLGVVHFVWRVKADLRRPSFFIAAIAILLLARVVPRAARRRVGAASPGREPPAASAGREPQARRAPATSR